jgi:DNA-binding GntR family transcriptional regulator
MLTLSIVNAISDAIKSRRLLPGSKLNERELAELFGVSRTIVRQALSRLAQDELVSIAPKRAATVARPSFEDAYNLYQTQLIIDCGVVDQLIHCITPEQLDILQAHTQREETTYQQGHHEQSDELGREYHRLLVGFLNNETLSQIHAKLERKAALITSLYKVDFDYCQLRHEHVDLIDALRNKQADRVKAMLGSHYKLVIRGYRFDVASAPQADLAAALQIGVTA